MGTLLEEHSLTGRAVVKYFAENGIISTSRKVYFIDSNEQTAVHYEHNLRPINIRGKHEFGEGNTVILLGQRTTMELIPTISGNLQIIKIRRGVSIT